MEGPSSLLNFGEDQEYYNMDLPPGFRFHPTDEEIISHYLTPKAMNGSFSAIAVGEVDLNKCEPWDLPKKAKMGGKEWYFFCQRDRKYPTGMRTNRATESGYWKATGKDKEIFKKGRSGSLVGMKKTLVFYKGRAPKGEKTNWVMHEYRLEGQFSYYNFPKPAKDEWVVCRVFHKISGIKRSPISFTSDHDLTRINSSSFVDDLLMDFPGNSLPPLIERQSGGNNSSFTDGTTEDDMIREKGTASSSSARSSDGRGHNSLSSPYHYLSDVKNHFMPHTTPDFHFHPQITLSDNTVLPINQYSPHLGYNNSSEKSMLLRPLAMTNRANNDDMEYQMKCKIEQFSTNNLFMVMRDSQNTGISTDNMITAETSSVISKKEMVISSTSYEDLDQDPNSVCPVSDNLDYQWNY